MPAGRSVWSGFIRFGLVTFPVKAYTATASGGGDIKLNQLHRECNSRINYKKTCPIHGELQADQIVSGYEFDKGRYVVVEPEEIEKLRSATEKAIDVKAFIPPDVVDARYFTGKNWILLPSDPIAVRPYRLLYKTMEQQDLLAFAQVAIGGREQLLLLRPLADLLVGSYVSFASEVKNLSEFKDDAPQAEVPPDEMKLAKTLVDAMKVTNFDLSEYKDDYTQKLTDLIQAKVEGKQIVEPPTEEAPHVINLMDALKKSLEEAKKQAKPKAKPPKVAAPSIPAAAQTRRRRGAGGAA